MQTRQRQSSLFKAVGDSFSPGGLVVHRTVDVSSLGSGSKVSVMVGNESQQDVILPGVTIAYAYTIDQDNYRSR